MLKKLFANKKIFNVENLAALVVAVFGSMMVYIPYIKTAMRKYGYLHIVILIILLGVVLYKQYYVLTTVYIYLILYYIMEDNKMIVEAFNEDTDAIDEMDTDAEEDIDADLEDENDTDMDNSIETEPTKEIDNKNSGNNKTINANNKNSTNKNSKNTNDEEAAAMKEINNAMQEEENREDFLRDGVPKVRNTDDDTESDDDDVNEGFKGKMDTMASANDDLMPQNLNFDVAGCNYDGEGRLQNSSIYGIPVAVCSNGNKQLTTMFYPINP